MNTKLPPCDHDGCPPTECLKVTNERLQAELAQAKEERDNCKGLWIQAMKLIDDMEEESARREKTNQRKNMHYANGRIAKNGDKVILFPQYGSPVLGILYDATAGNNDCNGKLAPCSPSDPMPDLKSCIHYDDVVHLFAQHGIPDSTKATVLEDELPKPCQPRE